MLFNSLTFLVFAALFFPAYFVLRGRSQHLLTLAASYLFYGWWDWRFLGLILFSTAVTFAVGLGLERSDDPGRRKALLIAGLATGLGLLGLFKYFDFFAASFAALAEEVGFAPSWPLLHLILPVGISFYTFQTLSYAIDVYRRRCPVEHDIVRFATYVALFPQLVAGPIVRATHLLPQLRGDHRFDWDRVAGGLNLVVWGYFLKLALADTLGHQIDVADKWFARPDDFGAAGHMIGTFLFSFQIYGDFAGYSLIAIGLGRIMGFDFGVNFRRPYFAASFSEFWQRWHISLSSWLRDYLYIPLGGSRHGAARTMRNLLVTMFLGGLWHGAAWTFVLWGLLHGVYLVVWHAGERLAARIGWLQGAGPRRLARPLLVVIVFALTGLAWIFFRAESVGDALTIVTRIVDWRRTSGPVSSDWIGLGKCLIVVAIVLAVDCAAEFPAVRARYRASAAVRFAAMLLGLWGIALLGTFSGGVFIYFQF
jgi:D-alanyl-lipoteichoic acid acyltransferase DltB (MBOAT superfamily)